MSSGGRIPAPDESEHDMTSMNPETTSSTRTTPLQSPMPAGLNPASTVRRGRAGSLESKPAWITTEFLAYVASVLAVIFTAASIGDGDGPNNNDYFTADKALLLVTILTVGYMVSRGIAKAGSRHFTDD